MLSDINRSQKDKYCVTLLRCVCVKVAQSCLTLFCDSFVTPGRNTGVGSLSLFQGIFPAQGSNPGLPHCGWILYQLSHKGSSRILEWVAYPFSRGSSLPRNRTGVSCIVEGLHCRRILYQLSYQGNSYVLIILGLNLLPKAFFFCIF